MEEETKFVTIHESVKDLVKEGRDSAGIPLKVFPNDMGINLLNVESETIQTVNGQLASILVTFKPNL